MKKLFFTVAIATSLLISATSCTSTRNISDTDPAYQQYLAQQGKQDNQQKPLKRTKRELNPCILKAYEPSANLRASGSARSFNDKNLMTNAIANAQVALAQLIETSISGAIQNYTQDATVNNKLSSKGIVENIMTNYVNQEIKNSKIVETYMEDLSDGSYQLYVCLEMVKTEEKVINEIANAVSEDEILGIQFDRERFINSTKEGLEEYKHKQANQ